MKTTASRGVIIACLLLLGGCGHPPRRSILELCGYLQDRGYRLAGFYDMQARPETACVTELMGGRTALVQVDGVEVMLVQKADPGSAERLLQARPEVPGLDPAAVPYLKDNLILYLPEAVEAVPEARRLLQDFGSF